MYALRMQSNKQMHLILLANRTVRVQIAAQHRQKGITTTIGVGRQISNHYGQNWLWG